MVLGYRRAERVNAPLKCGVVPRMKRSAVTQRHDSPTRRVQQSVDLGSIQLLLESPIVQALGVQLTASL